MLLLSTDFKSMSVKSLKLSINNDYVKIINFFMPDMIIAESEKENDTVLSEANRFLSSFALYKPSLESLDVKKLENDLQKVFLLNEKSKDIEEFSKFGLVVHSQKEYEKECRKAVNNVL